MDNVIKVNNSNPVVKSNIFSKIFFGWLISFCIKGLKRALKISDLFKCLACNEAETVTGILEKNWNEELARAKAKSQTPSLVKVIFKTFASSYFGWGIIALFNSGIIRSVQPVILSFFIKQYSPKSEGSFENKLAYGGALLLTTLCLAILEHQFGFAFYCIGMRMRVSCSSLIYRKLLRLSTKSLRQTAAGQVVNLLSNDVSRFDLLLQFLHYIWMMPFQVCLLLYLIWREVGISSVIGVVTMLVMSLPLQSAITKVAAKLRLKVAKKTDTRIKLMNQLIGGIQVVKMYVWEDALANIVKKNRENEIKSLTLYSYLRGILSSMSVFMERFITFVTIISYSLLGHVVTAEVVFSIASFYNSLQLTVAICFPLGLLMLSETRVSVKRLQEFLMLEEKQQSKIISKNDKAVILEKVEAFWVPSSTVLSQINVNIPAGSLCAVVGQVGSGKSSFLQLLLGELTSFNGTVKVGGDISYSSQDSWIFASTVRKNILFGQSYDKFRYDKVVEVCALKQDFKQFPYQDKTVVGEKGVPLSGGQRARINLARAVYRKADIYLLDDPLSAVDTHVGKHLFDKCIVNYLKGKTRILVTHQLQYLKKADYIIVLDNGRIEAQGTFQELLEHNFSFTKLFTEIEESTHTEHFHRDLTRASVLSAMSENWEEEQLEKNQETLVNLKKSPYLQYARFASNTFGLCLFFILVVASQVSTSGCDYWTSFWSQQEELRFVSSFSLNSTVQASKSSMLSNQTIIIIYSCLVVGMIVLSSCRAVFFYKLTMNASKRLHGAMFTALLKAPMRFFDINPMGRILNRFSKDIGTIDEILPRVMLDALTIMLVMAGILVNISISNYWMVIACVILGVIFYLMLRWYVKISRDTKQIEGIAKSPVFNHLTATINGLTTIRASKTESALIKEFDEHQNTHSSAWYVSIATISAFGCWLDILSVIFIFSVIFGFVFLGNSNIVSSSSVGLAVQQSMILVGMLSYGIRQLAEMVSYMTAVERVLEYTELEEEENTTSSSLTKKEVIESPKKGNVVFKDLFLYYSKDDPPVLKDLTFSVKAGEKVGIVGRTGAGKSSLISALFRLSILKGKILIDGVDTQQVPLKELRKKISIIPQEPILFSESVRYNLDPFQEFDDKKLWAVLEEVELRDSIPSLEMEVQEGGSNFSVGQRQLICLARAILRNNKILVLDEATANVDPRTDAFVQKTIRSKFSDCTVLTIAHRLNTVIDSDKILVMDAGHLVEFDHPHILLENKEGMFYKLIEQTGPNMQAQLIDLAKICYEEKYYNSRL